MIRKTVAGSAILLCLAQPAAAIDGVSGELGYRDDVRLWRAGLQWNWNKVWWRGEEWQLGGYWDLSAGGWRTGDDTVYDIGFTPVFRLARTEAGSGYLEAAIGFHLLSDLRVSRSRLFSTNFQFGDHVGIGRRFGPRDRYDISLRLQHLSNGGIRKPNPGIDFVQVRFQYHLK